MKGDIKMNKKELTFYVAECSEFHQMGEYHDKLASVYEAIKIYKSIDPSRMNGLPSIGVNFHAPGTEDWKDDKMDLLISGSIDLTCLRILLSSDEINDPGFVNALGVLKEFSRSIDTKDEIPCEDENTNDEKLERISYLKREGFRSGLLEWELNDLDRLYFEVLGTHLTEEEKEAYGK